MDIQCGWGLIWILGMSLLILPSDEIIWKTDVVVIDLGDSSARSFSMDGG